MFRGAGVAVTVLLCLGAVVLAVLLGPVGFSAGAPLDRWRIGDGQLQEPGPELAGEQAAVEVIEAPEPLLGIPVEVVVAMVISIVALALLVRSLLKARRADAALAPAEVEEDGWDASPPRLDVTAVAAAARRGLRRLDELGDADAGEVVVACWVELEIAAGGVGSDRRFTDTATDFALRLAGAAPGLDRTALDRLRRVYSRVRFGSRPGTADDVAVARAALTDLLDVLEPAAEPAR